ncbi:MAG: TylF/MycF/NovP-related O-methyltransferase, partial [Nitrospinaceae bacterium]
NEIQLIESRRIRNLDQLAQRLYKDLQARPETRIAFFGHTYHTARVMVEFQRLIGERFLPVCVIDNHKHGQSSPIEGCPVVSFAEAVHLASGIDLLAVMIDSPSVYPVLAQIAESPFRDKPLHVVHRDARPLEEPEFAALGKAVQTALNRRGVTSCTNEPNWFCAYQYLHQVASLQGDVAEFGVFQGGSALFLATVLRHLGLEKKKTLYLFDTFAGMVHKSSLDLVEKSEFSGACPQEVEALFAEFSNVRIVPGDVTQTWEGTAIRRLALAHVDCDQYEPTRFLCEAVYPRLVTGGILMFQNYGLAGAYGERVAVDRFFRDKPETVLFGYDGAAFVVKL